ncbi:MAG: 3-isopropylmalate dehydrogenase [Candidatus Sumerlaeota bacterium]|nr:3-isopropylmalate dehydrogenase [Candidatus Sumerlaeota bacterium]
MKSKKTIAVLPGDGIGQEVVPEALKVLDAIAAKASMRFEYRECAAGGESIRKHGTPITAETLAVCRASDAIFFGAFGWPEWDHLPLKERPEWAFIVLRKEFDCFANLRPIWLPPCLIDRTPFKREHLQAGVDFLIVRELVNGLYYGERGRRKRANGEIEAFDTTVYTERAVEQVARLSFELARKRRRSLVSMDKSSILESSRLWRETVTRVAGDYPDVALRHLLIDTGAMHVLLKPTELDVIVTNNEFGDILSDEVAVLAGSLGMIPSAALGTKPPFLFEPIHGSAPDIAGQGVANPIGAILAAAMMLEFGFGMEREARRVKAAVEAVLNAGHRTRDLARPGETTVSTRKMGDLIVEELRQKD